MKKFIIVAMLSLALADSVFAKDRDYQEGTVSMSTVSGHEVFTFTDTEGKSRDVAMREMGSANSLKMMNLADGGPPVKVKYRIGHKFGAGDFVAIPAPDGSGKEGKYFLTSHQEVTPETVQRAASAVPALRGMMRDPDSFVLEAVYLRESSNKLSQKHNNDAPEFCYFFRSHNAMGGYGDTGEAWLDEKGKLQIFDVDGKLGGSAVYAGMMTCTPKRRLADITAEVKTALNPPPPPPSALTPEEQVKRAQQYADCVKAAVNNPAIVCKP